MNLSDNQLLKILNLDNYSGFVSINPPEIRIAIGSGNRELRNLLLTKIGGTVYQRNNFEEWQIKGQTARDLIENVLKIK
jgi:hypothetical protein